MIVVSLIEKVKLGHLLSPIRNAALSSPKKERTLGPQMVRGWEGQPILAAQKFQNISQNMKYDSGF